MSGFAHQDWKPVILHKKLTKEEELKKGNYTVEHKHPAGAGGLNKQKKTDSNMRKLEQDDGYKPATVTHTLAQDIAKARIAKGLTQKELAAKISEPAATIQAYEKTTGTPVTVESKILIKINKALGTTFKKPPRPKVIKEDDEAKK